MKNNPRIAVIGAGNWGKNHVRVFGQLSVLAAVVDADLRIQEKTREQFPGIEVYSSYPDVLHCDDIDAVVVATPAPTHYAVAKEALLAGKDVLLEKPMTLSVEEAQELVSIAEERKKILMVGHLLLFKTAVQKIIECVRNGQIGKLLHVEMRRCKLGKVRSQENVLWSFAPHDIAVLLELVDAPVKKVTAIGLATVQKQIEDDVRVHIMFENDVQANIHVSWLWPEDERRTIIIGTSGMITYNEHENKILLYRKGVNEDLSIWDEGVVEMPFAPNDALQDEAIHFLDCLKNRKGPLTDAKKGVNIIEVLLQADINQVCPKEDYFAHESACIDAPVTIGKGTKIWHFSHVMAGSEIGNNCNIGQNVFVAANVKIGNNVKIQNNVSVYEGVILEDDVFCGPSIVFTNVKTPRSAYPRNNSEDYLNTTVKKGASLGANATIVCGVTIGRFALIGAGSVVTRDVPEFAVVYGNPAEVGGWICQCGTVIASKFENGLECKACNTKLRFENGRPVPQDTGCL